MKDLDAFNGYETVSLKPQEDGQIGFITSDGKQIKNLVVKESRRVKGSVTELTIKAIMWRTKEKGKNW